MKNKIIINALLFLLVFSSCKKPIENSNAPGVLQFSDLELIDFYNLQTASIEYIPLETNENILLSNIDKILADSLYYYILDTKSNYGLYVFNKKGGFVRTISARGNGPGEFLNVYDFDFDRNGNLYLLDGDRKRILKFDSLGVFNDEYKYDFRTANFARVCENYFIFFQKGRFQSNKKDRYDLILWNNETETKSVYFPYSGRSVPYGRFSSFYRSNNNIYYCNFFSNKIYEIIEGVPTTKFKLELGEHFATDNLFPNDLTDSRNVKQSIDMIMSDYYHRLSDYFETSDLATFRISKGKQNLLCFVLKENHELRVFDLHSKRNATAIEYKFTPSNIIGVDGDYLLSSIMPNSFSYLKRAKKNGSVTIKDEKFYYVIDNLDLNDNPIIVKFKIPANVFKQ